MMQRVELVEPRKPTRRGPDLRRGNRVRPL